MAGVALPAGGVPVLWGIMANGVHQVAVASGDTVDPYPSGAQVVVKGLAQRPGADVGDGGTGGGL